MTMATLCGMAGTVTEDKTHSGAEISRQRAISLRQNGGSANPQLAQPAIIEHMFAYDAIQPSLFGDREPAPDPDFSSLERIDLDPLSWIDYAPGWLAGDARLFEFLAETVEWEQPEVRMYDKMVRTPRLVGQVDAGSHPVLDSMVHILSDRYQIPMDRVSAGWYRIGGDSVAWHGDRIARELPHSIVATVSLEVPDDS